MTKNLSVTVNNFLLCIITKNYIIKHILRLIDPLRYRNPLFPKFLHGRCNICGNGTVFFFNDESLYRESLVCNRCFTTSRYRSIARGILLAIKEIKGIEAESIKDLVKSYSNISDSTRFKVYDTQVSFYGLYAAYPIPDMLSKCKWIDVQTSIYRPEQKWGIKLGPNTTNQNLEQLTFSDNSFDIVITSDVMEHVRLDDRAHQEI